MSHSADAIAALNLAVTTAHAGLVAAVGDYSEIRKPWELEDLVEVAQATAELHLAAVRVVTAAKDMAETARVNLEILMTENGFPSVMIPGYRVSTKEGAQRVRVVNASMVPHNYTSQPPTPPREPDIALIGKLLRGGHEIPGCELVTGKPSVAFTQSRKS